MEYITNVLWKISWQVAILAAVVWVITRLARKAPAAWRHALWVLVLIKFFIPPSAYVPAELAFWHKDGPAAASLEWYADPSVGNPWPTTPLRMARRILAYDAREMRPHVSYENGEFDLIAALWIAGVLLSGLVLLLRYRQQVRLIAFSKPASSESNHLLRECAAEMGIRREPRLRISMWISTPLLTGLKRPTVVLPDDIEASCTQSDLRAMLAHELAHIRRWDMAVIWLQQFAQMLFFFHPVVWLVGRQIKHEREIACDELVLSRTNIPHKDYASGYVAALRMANGELRKTVSLAMAEPFEVEQSRVRLMLRAVIPKLTRKWLAALLAITAIGVPTFIGYAFDAGTVPVSAVKKHGDVWLRYKNPPEWKWNGLTVSVDAIGRSPRLDSFTEADKTLDLEIRLRHKSSRWQADDFSIATDLKGPKSALFEMFTGMTDGSRYQVVFEMPSGSPGTLDLRGMVYELTPDKRLEGQAHPIADMKRPLKLPNWETILVTMCWKIGNAPFGYVREYAYSLDDEISPFPSKLRSAPSTSRFLTLSMVSGHTGKMGFVDLCDFVLYDTAGRSIALTELDGRDVPCRYAEVLIPYFGMTIVSNPPLQPGRKRTGHVSLVVNGIDPTGPASKAGVQVGDVVAQIDGKHIRTTEDFSSQASLDSHRLTLMHYGEYREVVIHPVPDPIWSPNTEDANQALDALKRACTGPYKEAFGSHAFLYSTEPLPDDFEPARLQFNARIGAKVVRTVFFKIKNVPIPRDFWKLSDTPSDGGKGS